MIRIVPQPKHIEEFSGYVQSDAAFYFHTLNGFSEEEYRLLAEKNRVDIFAGGGNGFFYALTTVHQLRILNHGKIPLCRIEDAPLYYYRGFMLDCARHTFSVAQIKKMIDVAAMLKFNIFHWHLSDDQGFRIALESFPELTEKGSVRPGDDFGKNMQSNQPYGGYFTKEEIRDVVNYCGDRYITVVPELDIPGHTSAILSVFPELSCKGQPVDIKTTRGIFKDILCAGNPETYRFLDTLTSELCEMFPGKYFHIGGDEAPKKHWQNCPKCRQMLKDENLADFDDLQCVFANKVSDMLYQKGKVCIVWNDILKGKGLDKSVIIQRWSDLSGNTFKEANIGRKIIISDMGYFYLDYPHSNNSLIKTYNYAPVYPRLTDKGVKNIIGIEAPVWTENINTDEKLEKQCLPRLFAVAEAAWTTPENKNYNDFHGATYRLIFRYLEKAGYAYTSQEDANPTFAERGKEMLKFGLEILPTHKNKSQEKSK